MLTKYRYVISLLGALLLLVACAPPPPPTDPTGGDSGPVTDGEQLLGMATVNSVDIALLESFPVQVRVNVAGSFADGCTTLDKIEQSREGNTFVIAVSTTRPAEAMCTQALVPFNESIPLDVLGLPAGKYTVDVNGITATFVLDVNNGSPSDTGYPPPADTGSTTDGYPAPGDNLAVPTAYP